MVLLQRLSPLYTLYTMRFPALKVRVISGKTAEVKALRHASYVRLVGLSKKNMPYPMEPERVRSMPVGILQRL